ncbi:MAG TPA: hypothetical protein VM686_27080 [Polyangiaceae bacterium]|jgi:hypothetical protein|nr:hypothetical protein [Polyangiaceae bacterium]
MQQAMLEATRAAVNAVLKKTGTERATAAIELSIMLQRDPRRMVELAFSEGLFVELTAALEWLPRVQWASRHPSGK